MKKYFMVVAMVLIANSLYPQEKIEGTKLDETVITTERYEENSVLETAKNVTVISSEEMEKRGYNNIEEALVSVPGLSFSGGYLSMRGQVPSMGNKHLVVLVDGIPQNGMDNRSFDLDFIPIESVEKIEVVPAGGGVMYGGNATSGVINIITKDTFQNRYWGGVGGRYGSLNERKYNLNFGTQLNEKLSLDAKYIHLNKDGYRDYVKKRNENAEFGLKYRLEDGKIGLKYIRNERKSNGAGYLTYEEYKANRRHTDPSYKEKIAHDTQDKYIFEVSKDLSKNLSNSTVVEYREREYTYSQPSTPKYSSYKSRIKNTDSIYLNTQFKYSYGKNSSLILGGDYSVAIVKEDGYGASKKKDFVYKKNFTKTDYKAIGGYVLNKFGHNDFIFAQGIRFEKLKFDENIKQYKENGSFDKSERTKDSKNNIDYELALNYKIADDTSTYLSYNKIYRAPNLTEFTSWKTDKATGKTEPRDSQEVDTIELGIKSLVKNVYLSGAIFYIRGNKEIMYDYYRDEIQDKKETGSYYNLNGKTERKGIELASEQYFDKLTLRENLTFMDNKIVDGEYSGNEIPGVSKLNFGFGATVEITPKLTFNLESNYHGKAHLINDYYNRKDKVKSYMVTNVSLKYDFKNGLILKAGVDNLFNEIYCDYITYAGKKINYSPSPERTWYTSAEYRF